MKRESKIIFIAIFFACTFLLRSFFANAGVPVTHDGQNHLARMANFYLAVKDLQIPPRWAPNLNYHYGYPVFNYNYYLAYIPGVFLHVAGFPFEITYKIIVFGFLVLAGYIMYLFLRRRFKSLPSLLGSILYISSPFAMTQIFVRGHMGTVAGLAIFPMGLVFINLIFSKKIKYQKLGSMGLAVSILFLALSHNVVFVFGLPVWILYYLLMIFENNADVRGKLIAMCLLIFLGLGLSAYFLLPAFGETGLTNIADVALSNEFDNHYVYPSQFVFSKWGYGYSKLGIKDGMSFSIGSIQTLLFFLGLIYLLYRIFYKKKKISPFIYFSFALFLLSLFFMTKYSSFFWNIFSILKKIQFPWRLFFITNFSIAVISAWVLNKVDKKIIYILIFITLILAIHMSQARSWWHFTDNFYLEFPFSSSIQNENLPKGFDYSKNQEYKDKVAGLNTDVDVSILKWKSNLHKYKLNAKKDATIVEHLVYFPGWIVKVDSKRVNIDLHNDPFKGVITYKVAKGNHIVETSFKDRTLLRIIGDFLSILSVIIVIYKIFIYAKK